MIWDFQAASAGAHLSPKPQDCIYESMPTMTKFNLAEAIAVLTSTPATLNALLRGLPNVWVHSNEGRGKDGRSDKANDTWSAFDIVGHLIVGERTDWMQ